MRLRLEEAITAEDEKWIQDALEDYRVAKATANARSGDDAGAAGGGKGRFAKFANAGGVTSPDGAHGGRQVAAGGRGRRGAGEKAAIDWMSKSVTLSRYIL